MANHSVNANYVWMHKSNQDNCSEMLSALRVAAERTNSDNETAGRDERIDAGHGHYYGVAGAIFTRQLKTIHHTVRSKARKVRKAGGNDRCTTWQHSRSPSSTF